MGYRDYFLLINLACLCSETDLTEICLLKVCFFREIYSPPSFTPTVQQWRKAPIGALAFLYAIVGTIYLRSALHKYGVLLGVLIKKNMT